MALTYEYSKSIIFPFRNFFHKGTAYDIAYIKEIHTIKKYYVTFNEKKVRKFKIGKWNSVEYIKKKKTIIEEEYLISNTLPSIPEIQPINLSDDVFEV